MMPRSSSDEKRLLKRRETFVESLEGIGDILVFEASRNKTATVLQGLKRLRQLLEQYLEMKKRDPEAFKRLSLSQDWLQLSERDPAEAAFRAHLDPEGMVSPFGTVVKQLIRIHQAAIAAKNDEISRRATYQVVWLLMDLTKEPGNDLFVQPLLGWLGQISREAIEARDRSVWSATVHWYTDIVFGGLPGQRRDFDLSYLSTFNEFFFGALRSIVDASQMGLFKGVVDHLHDGIWLGAAPGSEVWNYAHILLEADLSRYSSLEKAHQIEDKVQSLCAGQRKLFSAESLEFWLAEFEALKRILHPHLGSELASEAQRMEREARAQAQLSFKFNCLLELLLRFGAYCLYAKAHEFVRTLWEFKHPPDADATWSGHDIVPRRLDDIVLLYVRDGCVVRSYETWEGHHGTEIYYHRYFLLLLLNVLGLKRDYAREGNPSTDFQLQANESPRRCSSLKYLLPELILVAQKLKDDKQLLSDLGFDVAALDESFEGRLIPFLEKLKLQCEERLSVYEATQPLSEHKVEHFKREVSDCLRRESVCRGLFRRRELYKNCPDETPPADVFHMANAQIINKGAFLDDWHIGYPGISEEFARRLAWDEDNVIVERLVAWSSPCEAGLEDAVGRFRPEASLVIIAGFRALDKVLEYRRRVAAGFEHDADAERMPGYRFGIVQHSRTVPVLQTRAHVLERRLLVLDASRLGEFRQFSPLRNGDEKLLEFEGLRISVLAFSDHEQLLREYLNDPPPWLKERGTVEEQREFLLRQVEVRISERFDVVRAAAFEGYVLA